MGLPYENEIIKLRSEVYQLKQSVCNYQKALEEIRRLCVPYMLDGDTALSRTLQAATVQLIISSVVSLPPDNVTPPGWLARVIALVDEDLSSIQRSPFL